MVESVTIMDPREVDVVVVGAGENASPIILCRLGYMCAIDN
jgi:hypothetical protein